MDNAIVVSMVGNFGFKWKFSKIADVCIPETPPPLESPNVCNLDPPLPLKIADVLCGRPLMRIYSTTLKSLINEYSLKTKNTT